MNGGRALLKFKQKTRFRDGHHRMNDLSEYPRNKSGETIMKILLAGIAFAIGPAFATQAFALPCPNGTWQGGHYVCTDYNE
jgi:hypothetical protein